MNPQDGLWKQIEAYRRMTPQRRLQISFELYEMTKAIVRQGVKSQHADWNALQIDEEVLRRFRLGAGIP